MVRLKVSSFYSSLVLTYNKSIDLIRGLSINKMYKKSIIKSLNNLFVVAVNIRPDFFLDSTFFGNIFMRFKIDMVWALYRREQIQSSCNEDSKNQI